MSLLNTLHWRYATKKFNTEKKLTEDQITDILKGMNLAPSSLGLQPYEFIVIHDKKIQHLLADHSYGQQQITQASHIIVIAAKKEITSSYVESYLNHIAKIRKVSLESLDDYKNMILGFLEGKSHEEQLIWAQKQSYIVVGILMALCTDMHIDSCPMEGFIPEKYNEILGLSEMGLTATVVIPVGYRADDDEYASHKKVRKTLEDIVHLDY